jgi:hypothetical protein
MGFFPCDIGKNLVDWYPMDFVYCREFLVTYPVIKAHIVYGLG